MYTLHLRIT
ncbi:hypothetical protein CGLO_12325 [Colletotrichum gloeosporioides Cg-14]|uniref:Uncharacterized protein n=1 Tax=Colletotrichum gloeosporioides (strain Cg-14) TaxID=1237896 RepID=T0K8Y5_COLGC|nr:hypothetical protein CGLO_12325 [Colletotrichum gloeosporioides Cg-14]